MVNDPDYVALRIDFPMHAADRPALDVRHTIEDGALVISVARRDGKPFTHEGPNIRFDADGEPYVSFVSLTT